MYQSLFPSDDYDSAYDIDYYSYYEKGYRGILFDVDNTLVEHGEPVTIRAIELFGRLKETGFKTCIISNNKECRVKPLADALGSDYVHSKAGIDGNASLLHALFVHIEQNLERVSHNGFTDCKVKSL